MSTKAEKTLLLTRDDVARLLTLPELIEALRAAYCLRANHELVIRPQRAMAKYGEESTTVIFPGVLPDCERYTVKVNAKTAGNVARGSSIPARGDSADQSHRWLERGHPRVGPAHRHAHGGCRGGRRRCARAQGGAHA